MYILVVFLLWLLMFGYVSLVTVNLSHMSLIMSMFCSSNCFPSLTLYNLICNINYVSIPSQSFLKPLYFYLSALLNNINCFDNSLLFLLTLPI